MIIVEEFNGNIPVIERPENFLFQAEYRNGKKIYNKV